MGKRGASPPGGGVEAVLHTSVATFYNNLVTRPAGQAVRVAIEEQLREAGGTSLSILDFSHVGVIDFSCADEVIAKLLRKYRPPDRPNDAFFVVQGLSHDHRELVETVLQRQKLLLVAFEEQGPALWGPAPARLRHAWDCLGALGRAVANDFACARGIRLATATAWLKRLVDWRLAVPEGTESFSSLPAILDHGPVSQLDRGGGAGTRGGPTVRPAVAWADRTQPPRPANPTASRLDGGGLAPPARP